jgi:dolichyl-phosphate beta-glucosyltransferase
LTQPFLSIIIPAHNEEHRLPASLEQIHQFLQTQAYPAEIVVVENGSSDRTYEIAQSYTDSIPYLRVLHEEARGKGLAVQRGMLEAYGDYRFISDADLSMPIEEVNRFLPPQIAQVDIAISTREGPDAVRYNEPYYRHLVGRAFNTFVRLAALPGLQDTQCGFKCFRAEIAEDIFRCQTLGGMSFDVEILFIARLRGYEIVEVPIHWYHNNDSRVRLFHDSLHMGLDLLTIRRNAARGCYGMNQRTSSH